MPNEDYATFYKRERENFGLCEWIVHTCRQFKVDMLLIEAKASGLSVAQELKRLQRNEKWGVQLINPGNMDKVARTYAVQGIFAGGQVYCPDRAWSDQVITQFEVFPKGKHDDLVDCSTQALKYLRDRGFLQRPDDIIADAISTASMPIKTKPIYNV